MFEQTDTPRVFGIPPGADFPAVLVDWILSAHAGRPPEALAGVRVIVNTRRMQRRLRALFCDGGARLLPRIGLVTEVEAFLPGMDLPAAVSPLRRQLELARLVAARLARDPGLAPVTAAVDLAASLADLLDEMQSEGVPPARLAEVDVGEVSEYWERSLRFLGIALDYVEAISHLGIDYEARRSLAVGILCRTWSANPPASPVIVAGSTGSRAATSGLMQAVARLPQGAVILPGFDFDLPEKVWDTLLDTGAEDHPQFRFARLLAALGMTRKDVIRRGEPPSPERNRLISLSLRPAGVTNQWRAEGPSLGDLRAVSAELTLIEAPRARDEALAIGVAIREAVERSESVALVTPDRTLARRVSGTLARWGILPDDSAGTPLSLTPPGRFLRHVLRVIAAPDSPAEIMALLKHPLTRAGPERGAHLGGTRALELFLRQRECAALTPAFLADFVAEGPEGARGWATWLAERLAGLGVSSETRLAVAIDHHVGLAEAFAGPGALWDGSAGQEAWRLVETFRAEADFAPALRFSDYARLFEGALAAESDRSPETVRPDVMIWGTLEARVQGARTVILGGLNEGGWPEQPAPDPWLNRAMRRDLGLLSPERQIGLSAHDYQQAVAARNVVLTRAVRNDEGETVPSRWLSRLTNLMCGLPDQGGPEALAEMTERGRRILDLAARLDAPAAPVAAEERPAPAPPLAVRPTSYAVTEIHKLIRDPYAVYARRILRLDPLPPLVAEPDARLKGVVFHGILEAFLAPGADFSDGDAAHGRLSEIARARLEAGVPWPAIRVQWLGQIESISDWLIGTEQLRRRTAMPIATEVRGRMDLTGTQFSIRGKADRIDRMTGGGYIIYDYKTGAMPSAGQVLNFDRQLLIEAVMAEAGVFERIPAGRVDHVAHLSVGRSPDARRIDLMLTDKADFRTSTVLSELKALLARFHDEAIGYIARRAMETVRYAGDYDHLARFGEWDASAATNPERLP